MANLLQKVKSGVRIAIARTMGITSSMQSSGNQDSVSRVLFIANAFIPTLQLSFIKPLAPLISAGEIATELLSEQQMKELFGKRVRAAKVRRWIVQRFEKFRPTLVVFCRYSGPHVEYIIETARLYGAPTIFHIDDDLLNVPIEIGQKKYEFHNHPSRLATVRHLLDAVDLVYCSTEPLKQRLMSYGCNAPIEVGAIYCSSEIMVPAVNRPVKKIGYMGFDHAHDFEIVLPAINQILRRHPQIEFELFGSIPKPESLNEFGVRVKVIPPVANYDEFMNRFASLGWDIGICPLAITSFNSVKANTKWVEYTSVGAAVIASAGTIYDTCCADDCGLLAATQEEWLGSIELLISDSHLKYQLVSNAQLKLEQKYSVTELCNQVMEIFNQVRYLQNTT